MKRIRKRHQQNDLMVFLGGLAMLVAGLYWLTTKVTVSSGFFGGYFSLGRFNINSGLIVVPFIACIVWLFIDPDSFLAKVFVGLSVILIIAAIIMSTQLHMQPTSLYEYLIMLVFIFGGGAMVLRVITNPKYKDLDEKKDEYDYRDDLEEIKKRREE